ncbi:MAG: glycosyltransferase family 4 protein [Deltaproteobacteria bacterium]|nr:glycosyltransferase family 4 protein [Deltaproteobacteria bacterium]
MRVLVISSKYPSPEAPGYGVRVANHVRHMQEAHEIEVLLVASSKRPNTLRERAFKYSDLIARAALVRPGDFDLIHFHYATPSHAIATVLPWLRSRKPLVVTSHGGDLTTPPPSAPGRFLVEQMFRRAAAVIAVSGDVARACLEHRAKPEALHVIHMGCDLRVFRPRADREVLRGRLGITEAPTVLFVGDLIHTTGLDVLVEALHAVADRIAPSLVIVGSGALRSQYEALVNVRGLHERVRWLEPIRQPELAEWYAACDVVAFPARYEPFGSVTLEAMASGVPVVASGVGGVPEILESESNGLLVRPDDPKALGHALARVLTDRELSSRLRERALLDVVSHSQERQVARIVDLYEAIVTERAS